MEKKQKTFEMLKNNFHHNIKQILEKNKLYDEKLHNELTECVLFTVYHRKEERLSHKERILKNCNNKPYCAICNFRIYLDITDEKNHAFFTLDHIIPKYKGGNDRFGNIQPSHSYCNNIKDNWNNLRTGTKRKLNVMLSKIIKRMKEEGDEFITPGSEVA